MFVSGNPKKLLKERNKEILIVCHKNADIDALASAAILEKVLKKKNKVQIFVPEHANLGAKKLAERFSIKYLTTLNKTPEIVVIVDTNNETMLGAASDLIKNIECFLFDHHSIAKKIPAKHFIIEEQASSTTEVLGYFLKENEVQIDKTLAKLIACGIVSDTGFLSFGNAKTLKLLAEMLEIANIELSELIEQISVAKTKSEKIAILKAAKRLEIFEVENLLIATSKIGAFESQAANSLLMLGADIALVGGESKGTFRISARAKLSVYKKFSLDLARIFSEIASEFNCNAGGHATAAIITGKNSLDFIMREILNKISNLIFEKIGKKGIIKEYT